MAHVPHVGTAKPVKIKYAYIKPNRDGEDLERLLHRECPSKATSRLRLRFKMIKIDQLHGILEEER
ncbi:hypothetical protein BT96DRAFT_924214, partial [Gymnopus androsaceus JB14]